MDVAAAQNDNVICRPKKRKPKPETYSKNAAKKQRNSGKTYTNRSGTVVEPKTFKNIDCKCKKKCHSKLSADVRKVLHDQFWKIGDFGTQNSFLCGLIQFAEVVRHRPRNSTKPGRSFMNKFFLTTTSQSIEVCKQFFLQTFNVSDGRMTRALQKFREGRTPGEDLRGRKKNPRQVPDEVVNLIKAHINSFPCYQSHYTRKHNPNRKYLSESLNIRKMYELFKEKYADNRLAKSVKESFYRHVFNTQFNLHFHVPSKDTCKKCDEYKIQVSNLSLADEEKLNIENKHQLHLRKAEKARDVMKQDSEYAKNPENKMYVCSVDLQKALPFPVLSVSDAYYKRNMYAYNLGIHDLAKDFGYFYVWDETLASRGSQEIACCLLKHLKLFGTDLKHVIIFSDTCTGQNRNIKMALSIMKFLQSDNNNIIEVIEQKFLVSGHSFLANDRDFGSVELASRGKLIYVPSDWYKIMASARKKKPFSVHKMNNADFVSTEMLQKSITKRKKNTEKYDVNWLEMQHIRYEKARPYQILYKNSLNEMESFKTLDIRPAGRGRPESLKDIEQDLLYPEGRKVSKLKKNDMFDLLRFIPPIHHEYFQKIQTDDQTDNILPDEEDEPNELF